MASGGFFRHLRIALLLVILFVVAMNTWLTQLRTRDWNNTLWLVVYPINADDSQVTERYIDSLSPTDFDSIENFIATEAGHYRVRIAEPLTVRLGPVVRSMPPKPPAAGGGTLSIMLWSLQMRYWAFVHDSSNGPTPDIRMFVAYHDPARTNRLQHSLGLQKGMIGVVNAFASPALAARNNVVISHEFLHTVGATDKYDPATNLPRYPIGFAEPDRQPLYPQRLAEIMGGRIPLSEHRAVMPQSLAKATIGPLTAREIGWLR
jgi:hypothetical protein